MTVCYTFLNSESTQYKKMEKETTESMTIMKQISTPTTEIDTIFPTINLLDNNKKEEMKTKTENKKSKVCHACHIHKIHISYFMQTKQCK